MATQPEREDPLLITADEAISLLQDDTPYVHNFAQAGFALIGCDYERADAEKAFREADEIEIGGHTCKAMKHPLAVWEADGRVTFFEADMEKVAAFERAKAEA